MGLGKQLLKGLEYGFFIDGFLLPPFPLYHGPHNLEFPGPRYALSKIGRCHLGWSWRLRSFMRLEAGPSG